MAKIVTFTNQKGGEGKTSLAMSFGARLSKLGYRVLLVDMDPQCSLTYCMGVDNPPATVYEVLLGTCEAAGAIVQTEAADLLPASQKLSAADTVFTDLGKEYLLREALSSVEDAYDFIVIDSPPALGILTVNLLSAANSVVIPAQADVLSLKGVGQLYSTIRSVKKYCNPTLEITGVVLTRHKGRLRLTREVREMAEAMARQMNTIVFDTSIREAVAISESHAKRKSIFQTAPNSPQAADYVQFTAEYLQRIGVEDTEEAEKDENHA